MTGMIDYDKMANEAHRIYTANRSTPEDIAWMVTYNNFGIGFQGKEEADKLYAAVVDGVRMARGEIEIR